MSTTHTVFNATSGTGILDNVTEAQFDRWYDAHSDYRKVRDITEVNPMFRDLYEATSDRANVHWLVRD